MKQIVFIIGLFIYLAVGLSAFGQTAETFFQEGLKKAQEGKLEESIKLFSKSISLQPNEYIAWYNRGVAKLMLNRYKEALPDFNQTITLAPEYKKGYLSRGITKRYLTDYEGAVSDYSHAITLDPLYGEAYYNRGIVYELLNDRKSACGDFNKARETGIKKAQEKVEECNDTSKTVTYSIAHLTKTAADSTYGFTSANPVLVGTGPNGGPYNQKAYLELLRDPMGKPILYERKASCCAYPSTNGFMGTAMLDKYEITFLNDKGKKQTAIVYISFYDYKEPLILLGFRTVDQK